MQKIILTNIVTIKMKKMKNFILLSLILILSQNIYSQEEASSQTEKKGFIIIYASKNYDSAKKVAVEAKSKLNYKLDLRDLEYNKTEGLSFSKEVCEENGFEFPAYIQRGRENDSNFISVEYTNAYENFTKGYYIVVVASYTKGNNKINNVLLDVKKQYKTAYIKYTDVYVGCVH